MPDGSATTATSGCARRNDASPGNLGKSGKKVERPVYWINSLNRCHAGKQGGWFILKSLLSVSLLALLSLAVPHKASAIGQITTTSISFDGTCSDCSGHGLGTLVVSSFTPGSPFTLTLSNFVSFSYAGTNRQAPFVINSGNVTSATGTLGPAFPGPYTVNILSNSLSVQFQSSTSGAWSISNPGVNDFGSASNFALTAATPEPSSIALFAAGLACLGLRRRRN